jgi:hypothetical protein
MVYRAGGDQKIQNAQIRSVAKMPLHEDLNIESVNGG